MLQSSSIAELTEAYTLLISLGDFDKAKECAEDCKNRIEAIYDSRYNELYLAAKQKESGPEHLGDFTKYEGITYHGVSVAAILDTYNSAMVQPNPLFSGEMNYLANKMLSLGVTDIKKPFPEETVLLNGEDITAQVKEAWDFLVEHAFVM